MSQNATSPYKISAGLHSGFGSFPSSEMQKSGIIYVFPFAAGIRAVLDLSFYGFFEGSLKVYSFCQFIMSLKVSFGKLRAEGIARTTPGLLQSHFMSSPTLGNPSDTSFQFCSLVWGGGSLLFRSQCLEYHAVVVVGPSNYLLQKVRRSLLLVVSVTK